MQYIYIYGRSDVVDSWVRLATGYCVRERNRQCSSSNEAIIPPFHALPSHFHLTFHLTFVESLTLCKGIFV